jgi:hypothetical protein
VEENWFSELAMEITFTIDIPDNELSNFEKNILADMNSILWKRLYDQKLSIQTSIDEYIERTMAGSDWNNIVFGQYGQDLAINNQNTAYDSVVYALRQSMIVNFNPPKVTGKGISGGYHIDFIKDDMSDIISAPGVSYVTANGFQVKWLEWLLTAGQNVILPRIRILQVRGQIIAVKSDVDYRVPSNVAGTINDNFITRTFRDAETEISKIVERRVSGALS